MLLTLLYDSSRDNIIIKFNKDWGVFHNIVLLVLIYFMIIRGASAAFLHRENKFKEILILFIGCRYSAFSIF
jgi:cell division protein FtsW (lipid II flippase)